MVGNIATWLNGPGKLGVAPRLFDRTPMPYSVSQMVDASLYGGRIAHGSGQRFNYEYSLLPSLPALGYTTVYMQSSLPFGGQSVWTRYSSIA
jgi:hypothetical protein